MPGAFLLWHLLSLDAPTVAVVWAWGLARAANARPAWGAIAVLGIGTWMVYVADRLLDVRSGAARSDLRERHFFHARYRRGLLWGCAAALAPLLWLIAYGMKATARREDAAVFAISLLYFTPVHLPIASLPARLRFPRELVVGLLFAAAAAVPAWSRSRPPHMELAALTLLFAALGWLNCAAIHLWERGGTDGPPGERHPLVPALAGSVAAAAIGLMLVEGHKYGAGSTGGGLLAAAALVSAGLLLLLDRLRLRAAGAPSRLALRVAADAALLTPLLLLLWQR